MNKESQETGGAASVVATTSHAMDRHRVTGGDSPNKIKKHVVKVTASVAKKLMRKAAHGRHNVDLASLNKHAAAVIEEAFSDVDAASLMDYHCHIIGNGSSGSGCFVTALLHENEHCSFHKAISTSVLKGASGAVHDGASDQEFVAKLRNMIDAVDPHLGKCVLLAFDKNYDQHGEVNLAHTEFHVPNDYVFELSQKYPDIFVPACSIHPHRPDAIEELEKCAARGQLLCKWLPNAMSINPCPEEPELRAKLVRFYEKCRELGMAIITHTGVEKAVESTREEQRLGNPQLFALPLDMGVKVVMAHCGSLGKSRDINNPGQKVSNLDLFLRMMDQPKWDGLLFGDISATLQFNRMKSLKMLLARTDIHHRLLNGTDHPLPSVPLLTDVSAFVRHKMINKSQAAGIRAIYKANPNLGDYCLKRIIRGDNGEKFPVSLFQQNPNLVLTTMPKPPSRPRKVSLFVDVVDHSAEKARLVNQIEALKEILQEKETALAQLETDEIEVVQDEPL